VDDRHGNPRTAGVTCQMLATNLFQYINLLLFSSVRLILEYLQERALLALSVVSVHLEL
jgi:hypothetical protein